MRVLAILGPNAGERELALFRRNSQWEITVAEKPCRGVEATLIFGGDGTVHRHLRDAVESNAPVLPVPVGSGNDFHRALGIRSRADAVNAWAAFQERAENVSSIDLGVIRPLQESEDGERTAKFFCAIAHVGLDSDTAALANRMPPWLRRHAGYALALLPSLIGYRSRRVELTTDSRAISKQVMLATFANTPSYGGGMKVAPQAKLRDGLLDICVVRKMSKLRLLALFPVVYWGRHLGMKEVEYFQARCLRVDSEIPLDVYGDGEFVCRTAVEIGVAPQALKVITGNGHLI